MKLRWKILIAVGVFLVLLAASLTVTMHVQPAREVDAYKQFLRAKGEKLEISELVPPPVALEDNSADAVEAAFRMISSGMPNIPHMMHMVAPGKAMIGWQQPDARYLGDFTNSWEEFASGVESNRAAIEMLHQVLDRPNLDFELDYQKGFAMLSPQLAPMKHSAQVLDAAVIVDLHGGNTAAAVTNVITLLALIHKDAADGPLISYLVRMAMTSLAINPTWELLQATNLTDAQLAAVQSQWQQMDFLSDAEGAFVMERAWTAGQIEKSRATHEGFKGLFGGAAGLMSSSGGSGWSDIFDELTTGPRLAVAEAMWRSSWSYSDELHGLKEDQIILDTLRTMRTNQSQFYKTNYDAMSSRISLLGTNSSENAIFAALRIPDFSEMIGDLGSSGAVRRTLLYDTARRVVITAVALKRFQLKHGEWPGKLAELVPEFAPSVPIDPYDGKPLKYHPNTDGTFLLYSVGEDGVDDGGDFTPTRPPPYTASSLNWQRARDWVWPQPATPEEVQNFYEHPPK